MSGDRNPTYGLYICARPLEGRRKNHFGELIPSFDDQAIDACPTGSLVVKRVGYAVPVGQRKFDHEPIGSDIEPSAEKS